MSVVGSSAINRYGFSHSLLHPGVVQGEKPDGYWHGKSDVAGDASGGTFRLNLSMPVTVKPQAILTMGMQIMAQSIIADKQIRVMTFLPAQLDGMHELRSTFRATCHKAWVTWAPEATFGDGRSLDTETRRLGWVRQLQMYEDPDEAVAHPFLIRCDGANVNGEHYWLECWGYYRRLSAR